MLYLHSIYYSTYMYMQHVILFYTLNVISIKKYGVTFYVGIGEVQNGAIYINYRSSSKITTAEWCKTRILMWKNYLQISINSSHIEKIEDEISILFFLSFSLPLCISSEVCGACSIDSRYCMHTVSYYIILWNVNQDITVLFHCTSCWCETPFNITFFVAHGKQVNVVSLHTFINTMLLTQHPSYISPKRSHLAFTSE